MSDSLTIRLNVEQLKNNGPWPMETIQRTDEDGVVDKRHSITSKVRSPLSQAIFDITPHCHVIDNCAQVKSYEVSINNPASVVGLNALLVNDVYSSSVFACLFLQHRLIQRGVPVELVKQIGLEHSSIRSIDLTFLIKSNSPEDANERIKELAQRGNILFMGDVVKNNKRKSVVDYWSTAGNSYARIRKGNRMEIIAYVKSGKTIKSFCGLPDPISQKIFDISQNYVRFEVKLKPAWFTENRAKSMHSELEGEGSDAVKKHQPSYWASPSNWKGKAGEDMYARVFEEARELLRLNEKLNERRHRPSFLKTLSVEHRSILEAHYEGVPYGKLPFKSNDAKQRSKVKCAIQKRCGVDLFIAWEEQKVMPSLEWLTYPGMFEVENSHAHLTDYLYVPKTIKKKLAHMKEMMRSLAQKSHHGLPVQAKNMAGNHLLGSDSINKN